MGGWGDSKNEIGVEMDDVCLGISSGKQDLSSLKGDQQLKKDVKTRSGSSIHLSSFGFLLNKSRCSHVVTV